MGTIADRVVAVDGEPAIRPMMTMTLSSDHRVVDGARAAEFLGDLADAISKPETWSYSDSKPEKSLPERETAVSRSS